MNNRHLIYFIFPIIAILSLHSYASESSIVAFGKPAKDLFYATVSPQTTPSFPALYIYHTHQQQFLTKQQAESYLGSLDQSQLWRDLLKNWLKDSSQLATTNAALAQSLPTLKLDREYLIFYDNLPAPMLEQFKNMEPNLIEKDSKLKSILSQLDSARSYTTY